MVLDHRCRVVLVGTIALILGQGVLSGLHLPQLSAGRRENQEQEWINLLVASRISTTLS